MKKKGSFFGTIWGAFKFIFNAIKWLATKGWAIAKWVFSLVESTQEDQKKAAIERSRPEIKATCVPMNSIDASDGGLPDFESRLYSGKSLIGLILGSRGSGKSVLGMRMLENVVAKTGMKSYCMGFDRRRLPKWIEPVDSLDEVQNNSFLLVDEGGVEFSSRNSMSNANKLLSTLLFISRHKDINVLFISQNSANIEVNAIRQSDYLLLKQPSLLQLDFERKAIRDIYGRVKDKFKKHSGEKGLVYVYSDQFRGFAANSLPSFWSENLGKSYRDKKG